MYGTRDAAQNWHQKCSQQLAEPGFRRGLASPCASCHPDKGILTDVHGDDYVSAGSFEALKLMQARLGAKYQVITQAFGLGKEHHQQIKVLNRVASWNGRKGIASEADPRHVELLVEQFGLQDAKIGSILGVLEEGGTSEEHEGLVNEKYTKRCRAIIARCNHLVPDRPDVAYAATEFARAMASPKQ